MNKKIFTKTLILFVMVIVVNVKVEGASINEALLVVNTYQETARNGEWLKQSNLIIQDELDRFKDKLVEIPKLKALEQMESDELYAHIFGAMMSSIRIDESEIIDSVQESNETVYIIVKDTMIVQEVKKSTVRMLTVKYINNEWKISDAERLNNTAIAMHLQIVKSGTKKLRTQMLKLGKVISQMSKMKGTGIQKPGTQTTKIQKPAIQESVTQKPKKENTETQNN